VIGEPSFEDGAHCKAVVLLFCSQHT